MKIAVSSLFDPRSLHSWSGSSHFLLSSLEQDYRVELEILGPLKLHVSLADRLKQKFYARRLRNYLPDIMAPQLKSLAAQAAEKLAGSDADCVLALDAQTIAWLQTDKPVFYLWDCTFEGNLEYPWFASLAPECIAAGHDMESRGLAKATRACFSSSWAIESAANRYGTPRRKLSLVPLGANLHSTRSEADIVRLVDARARDRIDLLFIGVDWHRKGGDLAFSVARELNRRGLPARLTLVGCDPPIEGELPGFVEPLGFLDKHKQNELDQLNDLIGRSHFLIVPSLAESFGCVFAEASSFGTPSLARRVGGVDSVVEDDVNGRLFDRDADCQAYCDYIEHLWQDPAAYRALALSSFRTFSERLTWKAAAGRLLQVIEEGLAER